MCRCKNAKRSLLSFPPDISGSGPDRMNYEKNLLPTDVVAQHYDVRIDTNLKGDFKYNGHVDISVNITKAGVKKIFMHVKDMELGEVVLDKIVCKSVEVDEKEEVATFTFDEALKEGDAILSIDFIGLHNDQMNGFYRSSYKGKSGEEKTMISTQFEATDARRCFPCIDEPAAKATFGATLVIDKELTAISNMPIKSEKEVSGRKEVTFETSPKMSSYLLAFCVGEFEYIEHEKTTKHGTKLRVYATPGKVEQARFALDVGIRSLDLYDDLFGLHFPLPKMDMIAIPEFAAGAMENWGLVTYREVDLLLGKYASAQQKQRVAIVVAHELAHQWFGNLVTMTWWDDLWLNEGFASWMENYCVSVLFPEWGIWDQFVCDAQAAAKRMDGLKTSHPVQVPIPHSKQVDAIFDAISYCKGACVVQTVHTFMGHDKFIEGLQIYMKRHQFGNAETKDLCKAWDETLPGKNQVRDLVQAWTGQMGYPVLTIQEVKKGKNLELSYEQEWFLADGSESDNRKWIIPNIVSDFTTSKVLEPITNKKGKIIINDTATDLVKLNHEQKVMMIVNYTPNQWREIINKLSNDFGSLSHGDKAGLLLDARALVTTKRLDPLIFLELIQAFSPANNYVEVEAVILCINTVLAFLEGDLKDKLKKMAAAQLAVPFKQVGWEADPKESHMTALLRGLLFGSIELVAGNDQDLVKEAQARFDAYVKSPNSDEGKAALPNDYRSGIFMLLLSQKGPNAIANFEKLMEIEPTIENSADQKKILSCVGYVSDIDKKREVLDWTTKTVKIQDFIYGILGVSNSGDEGRQLAWDYLKENYDRIYERIATVNLSILEGFIIVSSRGFKTEEMAVEIEQFFEMKKCKATECVKKLATATRTAAKKLEENVFIKSEQVAKFLEKF